LMLKCGLNSAWDSFRLIFVANFDLGLIGGGKVWKFV